MESLRAQEEARWKDGFASGAVYNGDPEHIDFVNRRPTRCNSQANPLHTDLWPSAAKFEAEIVAMTAHMLGGDKVGRPVGSEDGVCGSVTSGGSESILLAMKTYRDWASRQRASPQPEIVVPVSAHAAFHKAAQYFNLKLRLVPLDDRVSRRRRGRRRGRQCQHDRPRRLGVQFSVRNDRSDRPAFGNRRRSRGIGLHVDGCLGGFLLAVGRAAGRTRCRRSTSALPGVTSMSCDTHKYGYAPKGTSVVLYRGAALRRFQYFTTSDWPGGLYYSPTFSGSRPGGLSAACWASLVSIGEKGYLEATRQILDAVAIDEKGRARVSPSCN